jgi:DnaJ-class molecular chaperone
MNDREKDLTPKYIPIKCVVCNGFGTLSYGSKTCHACGGKGYILVPPKEEAGDETGN